MTDLLTLKEQHPLDDLDHSVGFSGWLNTGDTLSSCVVTVSSGITLGTATKAPAISGTDVIFWLTGGTAGQQYYVQVSAETTGSRRKTVDGSILIIDPTPT